MSSTDSCIQLLSWRYIELTRFHDIYPVSSWKSNYPNWLKKCSLLSIIPANWFCLYVCQWCVGYNKVFLFLGKLSKQFSCSLGSRSANGHEMSRLLSLERWWDTQHNQPQLNTNINKSCLSKIPAVLFPFTATAVWNTLLLKQLKSSNNAWLPCSGWLNEDG